MHLHIIHEPELSNVMPVMALISTGSLQDLYLNLSGFVICSSN